MHVLSKTLIRGVAALAAFVALLYLLTSTIVLDGFARLEEENTHENTLRVLRKLDDELAHLIAITGEYAAWDDTYQFVQNADPDYIITNLNHEAFFNLNVNLMLFVDSSGRIVYGKHMDPAIEAQTPTPLAILDQVSSTRLLTQHASPADSRSGFMVLPSDVLLVASRPIVPSDHQGAIRGSLIMARYFGTAQIEQLAEVTGLSLSVRRLDDPALPADFQAARAAVSSDTPIAVQVLSADRVAGYRILDDVTGEPRLLLRVELPRAIYRQGQVSTQYLLIALVAIGLVSGVVGLSLLVRLSLSQQKRRESEELLRRSEEHFRRLIENSSDIITVLDMDGTICYESPSIERILGYPPDELVGEPIWSLIHDDDWEPIAETFMRLIQNPGARATAELRFRRRDGSWCYIESTGAARFDESGAFISVVNSRDITARKQAEEEVRQYREHLEELVEARTTELQAINARLQQEIAERERAEASLRASEERFRQLAENIHEVFWMTSPEQSQVLYISPAYEDIWGRSCDSLYRDPPSLLETIYPEDRKRVRRALAASAHGEPSFSEFRIVRPDGSIGWIWARSFPIQNERGEVYRIVGLAEDVTERKQAEEELRWALDKERELNELKSRFISMASHEFRTPLTGILSSAELLEFYRHKLTDEKKLDHLHRIQTAVKSMTQMLNDVLTIGKADAGKLEFKPAPLDVAQFCRDLVDEMQIGAKAGHTIEFITGAAGAQVSVDEKLLRHILTNLLSNAIKYSPQGGAVRLRFQCEEGQAIFAVQDQGIGIPLEEQGRLFDTFHRATNVGTIPGTGLGMAIVKRSVEVHGGRIAFSSQVGVGTTFTVSIPVNESTEAEYVR